MHLQIKFALKVYYPLPYKRLVCDYKKADINTISLAVKPFNCENAFNGKNIKSEVELFNKTLINIFNNFIPNKIKTFSHATWMNDDIKSKIKLKHKLYHRYLRHKRNNEDLAKLEHLRNEIDNLISKSKKEYYQDNNRRLNDPLTSSKTYWSIMETFFNGKEVPVIPLLLFNGALVTDFQEKANIFNSVFAKRCTLVSTVLPIEFTYKTEESIQSITFSESDVIKIIRALDVNKAHGHDNILARMIKLCTNSVAHQLTLIFPNSMAAGTFAIQRKRANIVPIHNKNDKQIVSNYRPVSLQPISSKIFEKLIFNELFKFFQDKNLLSKRQLDFCLGNSCIYQLLAITHDIVLSFDWNPTLETRGMFLDISQAFDRVWHDGLLFQLKQNSVSANLF